MKGAFHLGPKSEKPDSDDPMRATAESLIRIAIKAFMRMRDVDYETAQQWIAGAAVAEAKKKKPVSKSQRVRN